jgi:hypothetical protein
MTQPHGGRNSYPADSDRREAQPQARRFLDLFMTLMNSHDTVALCS